MVYARLPATGTWTYDPGTGDNLYVNCPEGKEVLGGGASAVATPYGSMVMTGSMPQKLWIAGGGGPARNFSSWTAQWANISGETVEVHFLFRLICAEVGSVERVDYDY
jgi:hypothetical protein